LHSATFLAPPSGPETEQPGIMYLISDIQYFAPISFYKISSGCSHIIFEQYQRLRKASLSNRCIIAGSNGRITLSIPLEKGRDQRTLYRDLRVFNRLPWQLNHWKTIETCYNNSPWFQFYRHSLEELYRTRFLFLTDWDLACFEWASHQLGRRVGWSVSESYVRSYDDSIDLRGVVLPKNYETLGTIRYKQVFEDKIGFQNNLSIIDLLFCEGNTAQSILEH
jgi:hypothetical protein